MAFIVAPGSSVPHNLIGFADGTGQVGEDSGIDPATVTTQGNLFNGANQLVQCDGGGSLPNLSGANLFDVGYGWSGRAPGLIPYFDGAGVPTATAGLSYNGADLAVAGEIGATAGGGFRGAYIAITGQLPDGVYTLGSGDTITITNGAISALS